MAVVLFDNDKRSRLYPFTYTKATADLYFGFFSIKERWGKLLEDDVYIKTVPYLQNLYDVVPDGMHTWIDACAMPSPLLIEKIKTMEQGDVYEDGNGIVAAKGLGKNIKTILENEVTNFEVIADVQWLRFPHEMLMLNEQFMQPDFILMTANKISKPLSSTNHCLQRENIFIEPNASVEFAIINAEKGPVYIGENATVMEGNLLKGPLFIGDNAVVKMGSKIYGTSHIGYHCTTGGEIKNSILQPYSNKAHDGYLGDSIIGEWCNLGAGVSNSNVKNTAGDILLYNNYEKAYVNAGNKFGVIMGDYTRVAINSSINTGSIYGVSCNVFGEGLLQKQLRNFSWGIHGVGYSIEKAIKHIKQWKKFKGKSLSSEEESVLTYIFGSLINEQ